MNDKKQIENISGYFDRLKFINELSEIIDSGKRQITVKTLSGSLKAITIAALWQKKKKNFLVIVPDVHDAEDWQQDIRLFINEENIAFLSEPLNKIHYSDEGIDENLAWLIDGLATLQKNDFSISIATPGILKIQIPKKDEIIKHRLTLAKGQSIDFLEFTNLLRMNGFDLKEFVNSQGDIAIRGGIVDIFPFGWDNPLRIEFFGNEIESIREFQPQSQRSITEHKQIEFLDNIYQPSRTVADSNIFDYLNDDTIVILDSPDTLESSIDDWTQVNKFRTLMINKLGEADVKVNSANQFQYHGSIKDFASELRRLAGMNIKLVLSAQGKIHLERFRELVENGIEMPDNKDQTEMPYLADAGKTHDSITWLDDTFTHGFLLTEEKLAVFTEHEIFDRYRTRTSRKGKTNGNGISLKELMQLKIGDYVVHIDKGIGKFDGFRSVKLGDSLQDCVKLLFAEGDILYVNLNYINKIEKYSAKEGVIPQLSKLGSSEWLRKKARTKKRLKDIARDLIKLYAERKKQPGYSFPADTIWQKEFEASFIYEDTPDQAQTTIEVKKDMESETPMDRLVCGDVGYGKTEVAVRAAFKAVQTGKQVAVLVPTTILAQQHYMTFVDRLSRYPVNIAVLSRFRSKKEQNVIVDKIKKSQIDILIGTHRLLSKDVGFQDLGLLIIDEEHRFGVGAKEKLRQLRTNVDTLTLTATPIPRTLNFSLMGARDLSIIETAPRNRLPVYTEIIEWNDKLIKNAVEKEIERKGQVFFVNDKIHDLEKIAHNLQNLLPSIRIAIAHGQMNTSELEKVMEKFLARKYDMLITTKIIESGIDIPNANTIFINFANNFGLAELYQLRGRVGRSNTQAYCYLIIPPVKTLSSNSLRRLQAIEEFTELGSGLQLAMRDMEIRGAGNLLGPEQSGYINEIGFEMYHKILDEAVNELKIEEFSDLFRDSSKIKNSSFDNEDILIELNTDAFLPGDYVTSETERFRFYKKLYHVRDNEGLKDIVEELKDRFGKLPQQAEELIFAVKMRIAALSSGFVKISIKHDTLIAEFPSESDKNYYDNIFPMVVEQIHSIATAKLIQQEKKLALEVKIVKRDEAVEIIWRIKRTVLSLID